jgi:glycosyltransferase involved in cell wall biosynthesis
MRDVPDGRDHPRRPRVSVIMPVKDTAAALIEDAVISFVQQDLPGWIELVVWDDGSTEPATIAAVFCGLAVISSLSPEADAVVTTVVVVGLGLGAPAGIAGYRVQVRRIRRDIEAGRGTVLKREYPPPPRRPVCRRPQRGRGRPARCRPGRTRYR